MTTTANAQQALDPRERSEQSQDVSNSDLQQDLSEQETGLEDETEEPSNLREGDEE